MKRVLSFALVWAALLPAAATTITFRDGAGGYSGTRDTFVAQGDPSSSFGTAFRIRWDADNPTGTGLDEFALLRFEDIVGAGPGQIPPGSPVSVAVLTYSVFNTGSAGELHEVLAGWTEASKYSTFCPSGCGPAIGPLVASAPGTPSGEVSVFVTTSVQAWVNGAPNLGFIVTPVGADSVEFASREDPTISVRPTLSVTFGPPPPPVVLREPYLQLATPTSMTLVWRTDQVTDSRVRYGTTAGVLDQTVTLPASVTNHVVTLTGLIPGTRYWYDVGTSSTVMAGGTAEHYFDTSPPLGSTSPVRIWVVGDTGNGTAGQAQVRDAMLAATTNHRPDLFLHMGDIAYFNGLDSEFTNYHFTPYRDILRHTVLWPTLGNHEGANSQSGAPGPSTGPYYDAFVLPTGGEAGGEPSGTEAYYSFDRGNIHFVSLNSYQVDRSITGAMATWLEADLATTNQPWIIAFWHHPPYTHGTHNSDIEIELVQMRENLLPILEDGGVDLVLGGHSHGYERSYLIDRVISTPTQDLATLISVGQVLDAGSGDPSGDGAYHKSPGINPHEGAVYVVAGHGGADLGGVLDHPVMHVSEAIYGSVILDVSDNTLTLTNLRATGQVSDTFTLVKSPLVAPVVEATSPSRGAVVNNPATIEVTFTTPVNGVDASDLTVAGAPASAVEMLALDRYRFTLSGPPPPGSVSVVLAPGGIAHYLSPASAFAGDSWTLTQCGPAAVTNLAWQAGKVTLVWADVANSANGGHYDLARGSVANLAIDGFASAQCLAAALATTSATDPALPALGASYWYLVRANTPCTPGTWGRGGIQGAPGAERGVTACP